MGRSQECMVPLALSLPLLIMLRELLHSVYGRIQLSLLPTSLVLCSAEVKIVTLPGEQEYRSLLLAVETGILRLPHHRRQLPLIIA